VVAAPPPAKKEVNVNPKSDGGPEQPQQDAVRRPPGQLHDYPVAVRWEVTRRHPYYLVFWSDALLYRQNILGDHPAQRLFRHAAALMLGAIGVTGEPVSPSTTAEELIGGNIDPAFLAGSVQSMTLRSVVAMLVNVLPPAERAVVGSLLLTAGDSEYAVPGDDDGRTAQKRKALDHLARIASAALDSCPEAPLFYVHLGASQRSIACDAEDQARRWKRRRGIAERRVHTDKLPLYLDVWDRREGWSGAGYDLSREHSFAAIAAKLRVSLSTVANRYRSAFQMVTGHPFKPELWWRLFGPLKYGELFGDPAAVLSAAVRHRLQTPVRRDVPDSVISPAVEQAHVSGTVERLSAVGGGSELTDLLIDLEEMFERKLPDEEIARRLGLTDAGMVAAVRDRLHDFRQV
jgi:hypothetical protein